ncbi:MAG: P-II family nitrogen regulator [Sulfurovum sp.]|nr:P-II family nitrogen regulator [Sulfurovum sp.]
MYLITAIINAECVKDILEDLKASEIEGVTLSKVKGKGKFIDTMKEIEEHIRIDIVVSNDHFKEVAKEAIRDNARNSEKGSGKMWVTPVMEVERIRTGETNEDALSHSVVGKAVSRITASFTAEDTPAS